MPAIRVILADDHTLLREGLKLLLCTDPNIRVIAESADGMHMLEQCEQQQPDIAIVDISLPSINGIEVARRIHKQQLRTRVLILTMHEEEEYVVHAVRAGAHGFLLKDSASKELITAVWTLAEGKRYFGRHAAQVLAHQVSNPQTSPEDPYRDLTDREREVFHLIIEGMTTKEIAKRLEISTRTAENHRNRVISKLDVRNTAELLRYAARNNLLI